MVGKALSGFVLPAIPHLQLHVREEVEFEIERTVLVHEGHARAVPKTLVAVLFNHEYFFCFSHGAPFKVPL